MSDVTAIENLVQKRIALKKEIAKIIVGQDLVVDQVLLSIFSGGHALLVGVPGLAKTLMVNTIAQALGLDFKRIQFTPDLMPSDILGSEILDENRTFKFIKGPIFSNIILADEINRTPPKTQAALLEAMQERAVTIAGHNYKLSLPYFVLATQNPIEQEGTYPLPEAQVDRFMLKTVIDYPKMEDERLVVRQNLKGNYEKVNPVVSVEQILRAQEAVREVYMDEKIEKYILDIIFATRYPEKYKLADLKPLISFGSSPRGSINLANAAKCYAFIKRRGYVIPEDVRAVVHDVLRHRIGITYEAEAENITSVDIINKIVNEIEVP
jgi:MoxR-like ATPase